MTPRQIAFLSITCLMLATGSVSCASNQASEPVSVKILSIRPLPEQGAFAVILSTEDERSFLPISVDRNQALSIFLGQKEETPSRPLTHDLLALLLKTLAANLDRVVITALRENVYYAELQISDGKNVHHVDARPSDAIALAVRAHAPIFVMPELLAAQPEPPESPMLSSQLEVDEWGLSVQELSHNLKILLRTQRGVIVADCDPAGPAAKAGIEIGDVLQMIDGCDISDIDGLRATLKTLAKDAPLAIKLLRNDSALTVTLDLTDESRQ